jgi:hypothetical protein
MRIIHLQFELGRPILSSANECNAHPAPPGVEVEVELELEHSWTVSESVMEPGKLRGYCGVGGLCTRI